MKCQQTLMSLKKLMMLLESFEQYLGSPKECNTPLNFQQSLLADEKESLDWEQIKFIQQWGFMDYLVPVQAGGKLDSLLWPYLLTKLIARRDITIAIALGLSFFAALPSWVAGDPKQQKRLGKRIRKGEISAFALTEEAHGSDLTANEMKAVPVSGGWELSGSKWCVNFATEGQSAAVLCRTHEQGGLLGFSLFFIDKSTNYSGLIPTVKLPTHGVRGLDISGFTLDKYFVPTDGLIGKENRGLEITYKSFQISRTLLASVSLGGADTALRLAVSFSLQRQLYSKPAFEIPVVKQRLGEQFTQLLIADCTALAMVRACTVMPEKMSLWSAITKFLIPNMAEEIVEHCAVVMGARAYLRTTEWAIFQKIRRDIQVVSLFDGSSQVNLALIAGQLLPQVNLRGTTSWKNRAKLELLFKINEDCPSFNGEELGLFVHEEDELIAGLFILNDEQINPLVSLVCDEVVKLDQEISILKAQKLFDPRSLTAFRLAERYCWIFAASCCLHFWHYNQEQLSEELKTSDWITLAIQWILNKLNSNHRIECSRQEIMASHLCHYHQQNKLFSVIPTQIAE